MAKFYNNRVKTGRLAGSVFAVRFGETIERAYQPVVANPNTQAQIESRAKLKLLSQLAAVMAPVIAMARVGAVSSRNRFLQLNYRKTAFAANKATVDLLGVSITKSVLGLSDLVAERDGNSIKVRLHYSAPVGLSRMVYAAFIKQSDDTLRYHSSNVVNTPGVNNVYEATFSLDSSQLDVIFYAYGVRDNTENARVIFENMKVPSAENIAQLVVSRTLTDADITLTETQAIESVIGE